MTQLQNYLFPAKDGKKLSVYRKIFAETDFLQDRHL